MECSEQSGVFNSANRKMKYMEISRNSTIVEINRLSSQYLLYYSVEISDIDPSIRSMSMALRRYGYESSNYGDRLHEIQ